MRIGISVTTHAGQHIWENGLGQNIIFLARLLRDTPGVEAVYLLNCGDQDSMPPQAKEETAEFPLVSQREVTEVIDVAIEMGGALNLEWMDHIRARGRRVVFLACGQPYAVLTEPNIFDRDGFGLKTDRFDEVWVLPKDRALIPMMRMIHRCEVFEAPYLWSPRFLDKSIAAAAAAGLAFGFEARQSRMSDQKKSRGQKPGGFRAAIFEPNISVTKVCVAPMLICDSAYRRDPNALIHLNVLNSLHMVDHPTFNFLAHSLDMVRDSKAVFLAREEFAPFMAAHADLVVSHQWGNDQNYLYLDALHGGYPLVHNSPWIADIGYYYEGTDIHAGATQVLAAVRTHADNLETYKAKARALIASLDPGNRDNQAGYARRLLHLGAKARGRAAA